MTVRILRLMEYTYNTPERMEQDMEHWHIPANGVYARAPGIKIKSCIITDLVFQDAPPTRDNRFQSIEGEVHPK